MTDDFDPAADVAPPTPSLGTAEAQYRRWVDDTLTDELQKALDAGNRVVLLRRDPAKDDNKVPLVKGFNDPAVNNWRFADLKGQAQWALEHGLELTGYGYVGGAMSGNRLTLDVDRGDWLARIAEKVRDRTGIDLMGFPRVRSGRTGTPGYHIHCRTTEPLKSGVLVRCLVDGRPVLVAELKATGCQVVGPGSRHKSGRLYAVEFGDPHSPPLVPIDDARRIIEAIRVLNEIDPPQKPPRPPQPQPSGMHPTGTSGRELADRYNAETTIEDALEAYGYRVGSRDYYIHPANDTGQSVHLLGNNRAHHFGANDPFGCGSTSTPFHLLAHFECGGDWGAAVRALAVRYGVAHEAQQIDPADCIWESDADAWLEAEIAKVVDEIAAKREVARPLRVDLSRFPDRLRRGLAGLAKANPLLPLPAQILVPFTVAGAIIGKRRYMENFGNLYYPNLWNVVVAPTNANKTGTRNLVQNAVPLDIVLPDSATMEALLQRLGRVIQAKEKHEESAARTAAILEDRQTLTGGLVLADEVTGTLKKLLGGDGRNPDRNIEDVLRLASSGEMIQQPRVNAGFRIVADLCVSVLGFTQADAWEAMFGHDRYRTNGLIGRIIPCCDGLAVDGLPDVGREEWGAFVGATTALGDGGDGDAWLPDAPAKRCIDFGVSDSSDPIRQTMKEVKRGEAWRVLAETVGDYADALNGKIIGHALKLAMVCDWFEGHAPDWFGLCAELVTACYANYFRATYGAKAGLSSQEHAAIAYVRANPGCSPNELRKKLGMRDNREIYQLVGALVEAGKMEQAPGRRKGFVVLHLPDGNGCNGGG